MTARRMTICKVQRNRTARRSFSAICEYLGLSERIANEDAFLERVIATIKEELAKANPFGLLQLVQTPPAQIPAEKENKAETEETVMDFMDNF